MTVLRNGESPEQVHTKLSRENKVPSRIAEQEEPLGVGGELQREAFQEIKQALVLSPILALLDPNCETVVSAHASSYGLGAVLLQKQPDELSLYLQIPHSYQATLCSNREEPLAFTWACE